MLAFGLLRTSSYGKSAGTLITAIHDHDPQRRLGLTLNPMLDVCSVVPTELTHPSICSAGIKTCLTPMQRGLNGHYVPLPSAAGEKARAFVPKPRKP
jgi:hypothetical protein